MSAWRTQPHLSPDGGWDALTGTDPTLSSAWLEALTSSGSAAPSTGWQPLHLMRDTTAALPLYAKSHSYGEYVFDSGWARAAQGAGLRYYPKLVSAVPFTPATGHRLLGAPGERGPALAAETFSVVRTLAAQAGASSWHVLFPQADEAGWWREAGLLHRLGCQYHWVDRGYGDFEGFLGAFRASRRKTVRRERRAVAEQGVQLQALSGAQLEPYHWDVFRRCYRDTYGRLSGHDGYLTDAFFEAIAHTMQDQVVMILASHGGQHVAAALCLRSGDTLYGRYWGSLREFPGLHFEACYYQGIAYCLAHGLSRFDPGAQGEHKVPRGFEPVLTHSCHWLAHPGLAQAVDDFLAQEREQVKDYAVEVAQLLPFRREDEAHG